MQRNDLVGKKFGRLTVLEFSEIRKQRAYWSCRCECGAICVVAGSNLTCAITQSCGCFQKERTSEASKTHGLSSTLLYGIWFNMRARCMKQSNKSYVNYGERGIYVCDRWKDSFENFYEDMGPRPSTKHSLDRIDNNGPYSPDNCRWVTNDIQASNKRSNRNITYNGKTQTFAQWCKELNLPRLKVLKRLLRGWDFEQAISVEGNARLDMYTIDGKTQHLNAWCRELGMNAPTVVTRIKRGWPIEKALKTPVLNKWSRHKLNYD